MLTVKFVKYRAVTPDGITPPLQNPPPAGIEFFALRPAEEVYVDTEKDGRQVVQLVNNGDFACGDRITVGRIGETSYDVAYVLNAEGKTIETVR